MAFENERDFAWLNDAYRISIRPTYDPENIAFFRSLPEPRYTDGKWTFAATPCTAHKLMQRGFGCDIYVAQLARRWTLAADKQRSDCPQPPRRKTDSRISQRKAFWFSHDRPASMLAMRMGLGKTKVAIDLAVNWGVRRVLILCPKSVIGVWPRELERHGPDQYIVQPLDTGTTKHKVQIADKAMRLAQDAKIPIFVVVNYETAIKTDFANWAQQIDPDWELVICDESHRIKQPTGKASKLCFSLGKRASRKLCLTGTPMPHSPLDIFAQYRFLDAGIFGTSWTAFRQRYAVTSELFPNQVKSWINQDELRQKFEEIAFVATGLDELDLPPVTHEVIPVRLPPQAEKIYRDVEQEMVATLDDLGESSLENFVERVVRGEVTCENALVKLLRLQQLASGHVTTDDDVVADIHTAKAEALAELIDSIPPDEPICVFANFIHNLEQIRRVAEATGRRYGEISGRRKDLTPHATMPDWVQVMGVQWQSGSVGIDLTRSRYGVIYTPTFNGGNYIQGLSRQHRPGQTKQTFFYHLQAIGTVDYYVYAALQKRMAAVNQILAEV